MREGFALARAEWAACTVGVLRGRAGGVSVAWFWERKRGREEKWEEREEGEREHTVLRKRPQVEPRQDRKEHPKHLRGDFPRPRPLPLLMRERLRQDPHLVLQLRDPLRHARVVVRRRVVVAVRPVRGKRRSPVAGEVVGRRRGRGRRGTSVRAVRGEADGRRGRGCLSAVAVRGVRGRRARPALEGVAGTFPPSDSSPPIEPLVPSPFSSSSSQFPPEPLPPPVVGSSLPRPA